MITAYVMSIVQTLKMVKEVLKLQEAKLVITEEELIALLLSELLLYRFIWFVQTIMFYCWLFSVVDKH